MSRDKAKTCGIAALIGSALSLVAALSVPAAALLLAEGVAVAIYLAYEIFWKREKTGNNTGVLNTEKENEGTDNDTE